MVLLLNSSVPLQVLVPRFLVRYNFDKKKRYLSHTKQYQMLDKLEPTQKVLQQSTQFVNDNNKTVLKKVIK